MLVARRSVTKFSQKIDLELNFAFQGFPPRIFSFLHEYFRWNFNVDIYLPLKRYKKNFQQVGTPSSPSSCPLQASDVSLVFQSQRKSAIQNAL